MSPWFASGVTDIGLALIEEFVISKGLGGKVVGSLVGSFYKDLVEKAEVGREIFAKGTASLQNSRWAAVGSAAVNTLLDEAFHFTFMPDLPASKQGVIADALITRGYTGILNSKAGKVIEYIDKIIPDAYSATKKAVEEGTKGATLNAVDQAYFGLISGDFEGFDIGEMAEAFTGKATESVMKYAGGKFFDYTGAGIDAAAKLNSQGQELIVLLMCYAQGSSTDSNAYNTSMSIAEGGLEPTIGDIAAILQAIEKDKNNPEIVQWNEELANMTGGKK